MLRSQKGTERPPRFFFIIGGQRCGSTMLRRALAELPEIRFLGPERPEPKTFLASDTPVTASQYAERFGAARGLLLGEKSTSYLDRYDVAERMNTALPSSKLVAIVREPFARAVSHYKFSVQHGAEPLAIEEALTPEAEARDYDVRKFSVSPYLYLTRGRYADLLQPWMDVYGRSRLHVVVLERLIKDPSTLVELHRFLEIPEREAPNLFVANSSSGPAPQLAPERVRRIRESFVEPNSRLAAMFDLDLDLWRPEVPSGTGETAAQEPREDRSE